MKSSLTVTARKCSGHAYIHKSVEAANSSERMKSLCLNKTKLGEEYKALAAEVSKRMKK